VPGLFVSGRDVQTSAPLLDGCWEGSCLMPAGYGAIARKMALALDVSLDYLVGSTDLKLDAEITKKIVDIQKLSEQEKSHLFFVLDNVLQNIRTKVAFAK